MSRQESSTAVLVGVGEMGGVFARALLRSGHVVVPVNRGSDVAAVAAGWPDPDLALIAVGELDLPGVLANLPTNWNHRACLLQNELVPAVWEGSGIVDPTVVVAWFEKKPGQDVSVIVPSPIGGPNTSRLIDALATVGIPAFEVAEADGLAAELVAKNLYILTCNIAGLMVGETVDDVWNGNRELAEAVASDVLDIQEHLFEHPVDRIDAVAKMRAAIEADPNHKATGRSAEDRLARAIRTADSAGLEVPMLRSVAARATG